eukprot:m.48555 g.48555  ORF g.48555 m.48555 type:complete len:516 (-) comp7404_c0_seq2:145-1692(-)
MSSNPHRTPLFKIWSQSVAGEGTSVHVENDHSSVPRLAICFDTGRIIGRDCSDVFISHCHMDHIQNIILHARSSYEKRIRYHIPAYAKRAILEMKRALEYLDESRVHGLTLIPYEHYQPIHVGLYEVIPVPLTHRVAGTGFAVTTRDRLPLPEEFRGLPGAEIRELYEMGIIQRFSDPKVKLFYTGDCMLPSLLKTPLALQAHTLICEATYLCQRSLQNEKHEEHSHIHLQEVANHIKMFENVQHFHFIHFSKRYGKEDIMELIQKMLSTRVLDRVSLSLSCFRSNAPDLEWAMYRRFHMKMMEGSPMTCYCTYTFTANDEEMISRLAKKLAMVHLDECTESMEFLAMERHLKSMAVLQDQGEHGEETGEETGEEEQQRQLEREDHSLEQNDGFSNDHERAGYTDQKGEGYMFQDMSHQYETEQQGIGCVLYPCESKRAHGAYNAILYPLGPTAATFLLSTIYPHAKEVGLLPQKKQPISARYLQLNLPSDALHKLRAGHALLSLQHMDIEDDEE